MSIPISPCSAAAAVAAQVVDTGGDLDEVNDYDGGLHQQDHAQGVGEQPLVHFTIRRLF